MKRSEERNYSHRHQYRKSGIMMAHDSQYALMGKILRLCSDGVTRTVQELVYELGLSDLLVNEKKLKQEVYYARRMRYISQDNTITNRGYSKLAKLEFEAIPYSQEWDGLWRIVVFDIPEAKRSERDSLRRLMRQVGFKQLQKSVWAHPMPCRKQIREIQNTYTVVKDIVYLEASAIDGSRQLLKLFQ